MTKYARLSAVALCVAVLIVLGISRFGKDEGPTSPPLPSEHAMQPQAADFPTTPEANPSQTSVVKIDCGTQSLGDSAESDVIQAFKQWAESAMASGFAHVDEAKGMELAKARASAMKALIQQDPAAALREALSADLRAKLSFQIAAAIEQPVHKTGICSMRITCNHSDDTPHGNCSSTPVLLEDVDSWNAYYTDPQWETLVGQTVEFEGVAVEGELAVARITPAPLKEQP